MSGTSLDGIDCVLVDLHHTAFTLVLARCTPYPSKLQKQLWRMLNQGCASFVELGEMNVELGECYADACLNLLKKGGISPSDVIAIGCHGQTLYHSPHGRKPFTWQLGDANVLHTNTSIPVVSDFRGMDVALGGEGAPLAPGFHAVYFSHPLEDRAVVNIGGIANITQLYTNKKVLGFDTGPGNGLMNQWMQKHFELPCDKDGQMANSHPYDQALLSVLLQDPYFKQLPPKSTGNEYFNLTWLNNHLKAISKPLAPPVVLSTLCQLTAHTITLGIHSESFSPKGIYICGGGAHNTALMKRLSQLNPDLTVQSTASVGLDPDWVEAVTFAWLAKCRLSKEPANLPSVTGAKHQSMLGSVLNSSSR